MVRRLADEQAQASRSPPCAIKGCMWPLFAYCGRFDAILSFETKQVSFSFVLETIAGRGLFFLHGRQPNILEKPLFRACSHSCSMRM